MNDQLGSLGSNRRLRPPNVPDWVVPRPRLDELFAEYFCRFDVIEVVGSPGAGKTVAAQTFASGANRRTAWLNLDAADRSASRLIVHIAQALGQVERTAPAVVEEALRTGVNPVEVAASLADNVSASDLLLVLDNCEEVGEDPGVIAVVTALLTYLPATARTLLLSRQPLDSLLARIGLDGRVARVGDVDLAFNAAEARTLIGAAEGVQVDVDERLAFTGGWAAGMIFATPMGARANAGDLASYLNSQLLGRLPEDEQAFLLRTSMLAVLTPDNVDQLCGSGGPALLKRISRRQLLSVREADGSVVHHPCFRQFLSEQLPQRLPAELTELQVRYARILAAEGEYEAAVTGLLRLGLHENAAAVAERALPALYDRGDWSMLLDWLDQLSADLVSAHPLLLGGRIRALTHGRRLPEAQSLIRELDRTGRLHEVADIDPGVVAHIGWAFMWEPLEGLEITGRYSPDHRAAAIRYTLRVTSGLDPTVPPPGDDFGEVNRILTWGMYLQGRLDLLADRYPSPGSEQWPPRRFYRTPQPLLSLIWRGELEQVRTLWDEVPLAARQPTDVDLSHNLEAWILLAEGNAEAAVRAGSVSVGLSQQTRFGWEPYLQLVVAQALIRLGRYSDARSVLAEIRARCSALGQVGYLEWAQAYDGLAQLLTGDSESALQVLEECVQSMRRSGRKVMLPGALSYLSEAVARGGDNARARELADEAVQVARATWCEFPLQQALIDLPQVAGRFHDAPDTAARLGLRRRAAAPPASGVPRHIEVRPFGHRPDISVDGQPCGLRRLKVIELAVYLATHGGVVARHQVQLDLFPEHDQKAGSNYFRQIAHQFGRATGVPLVRKDHDWVSLAAGSTLTSIDVKLQKIALEERSSGQALDDFLSIAHDCEGTFLAASPLPWVDRRRFELDVVRAKVLQDCAETALERGSLDVAERLAEWALKDDPFCEWAFLTLDAIARRSDLPERRSVIYRRAEAALSELDLRPEDIGLVAPRTSRSAGAKRSTPSSGQGR